MIIGVYVIAATIALFMLAARLHETRDELARVRRQRDAYAHAVELALLAPAPGSRRRRRAEPRMGVFAAGPEEQAGLPDGRADG
jgi:hypothetical protein